MQEFFYQLADYVQTQLQDEEQSTCYLSAESSDFVRFNHSTIRQPGHVQQIVLRLQLLRGSCHSSRSINLSGNTETDLPLLDDCLLQLRSELPDLPADPHWLSTSSVSHSSTVQDSALPSAAELVAQILAAAAGLDLVGLLSYGSICRGFANCAGQRNWYQTKNFNFDWSLFHAGDKAIKSNYAGMQWDQQQFLQKFALSKQQLLLLARPAISITPGDYRVYLTPTALNELLGMLNWRGLSEKALRTQQSCLQRLHSGAVALNPALHLWEDKQLGIAPSFQEQGFIKPPQIALIRAGQLCGSMVSPRSAKEYGIADNGADSEESCHSLRMQGGELDMEQALAALGTGIYISNLWYLNFSDRASCRITGMTRFACFWVEDGVIRAPLNVMRFDDSLYRLLGDELLALTTQTELIMDDQSYGERRTGGAQLPGALLKAMRFVL
ncbi:MULTISPECIES: metallopeptidase TldD-related protein [unclassified Undibacterium]|uniref:metallopeptidase TldD-related protein n=1 Tax=unclassified Undibacterium TaxID=2630295 RepID=UPI002AC96D09|nr:MULTISPECIES: metallopeptidase TldD-related protein [unclassified Undibacterium]MEB0137749.1 metallopeptidase TldD-related protein [Undibacterium sp. CCC2.1]MEB0172809.1 metallopeptidase TldD-related protein [Undibacterium sp. CCC1.1]MEB0176717.1 metallopeptidase TldD-related protein [Undibacterium sp. CCC3.4]MEB0215957.1 metallopeptidase TldD-related protein [Undibacterium sp. 5I2]WPX42324.1 metallopeptidase TldD-related protein [Undibacterium sp. CCC3.4]